MCLLLLQINSAGLKNWYFTLISPYHLWRVFVQCMNNFLRLSLINQINFSEFIISHTTQKRKMRSQCSKKHNLLLVIFYAELNNFSGLQSCNLLYLYVAQISCLTLAQRVLTACRDLTRWKMYIWLVVFLVIYISYQTALCIKDTNCRRRHKNNSSVCSTAVIHQVITWGNICRQWLQQLQQLPATESIVLLSTFNFIPTGSQRVIHWSHLKML